MSLEPKGAIRTVPPAAPASEPPGPVGVLPATPPSSLDSELRAAAQAMDALRAKGRTLHFEADPERRRVRIEIRDLDGNVLCTIPPSEAMAMAIAAGRPAGPGAGS